MHSQSLYFFFITSLLLNLTPGNDVMYVASRSISQGRRAGIVSALGIFSGGFIHIAAAVFGLSVIIAKSTTAFSVIKFAGAGYLIYLGIKALLSKTNTGNIHEVSPVNYLSLYQQGILTNVLNPKVAIFFISFLPQFVDPAASSVKLQLLSLGLWFNIQGTLVLILYAFILGAAKNFFRQNQKVWQVQQKITGGILIALGIKVALTGRR